MGTVLVVAAHPDDEVLGVGATMARLTDEGEHVVIAILGEGLTSRGDEGGAAASQLERLKDDARCAANVLAVSDVRFAGLPDNQFDTVPLLDVAKIVEGLVGEFAPNAVYTHHGGDLNVDHQVTFRAVLTACRPLPGSCVRAIYTFEVPSATDWSFGSLGERFEPNRFVNVEATLQRKMDALDCYASEMREFPHPRSATAVRAGAVRWGSVAGVPAAEAFRTIRTVE